MSWTSRVYLTASAESAADGGNAHAAYGLGSVLEKLGDRGGARAAFQRAHDLGHEGASKILETMDIEVTAHASAGTAAKWAQLYVAACGEVFAAANACLEVTNRAIGARNLAAKRPQVFLQGIDEANGLMQNPRDEGNIYRPRVAAQSDERTCPWCAETIKAAAVICRFCGLDVQMQANAASRCRLNGRMKVNECRSNV